MRNPTHNIARVLSKLGHCSRRQAVELVLSGRVSIGSRAVTDPGELVPFSAEIVVDGKRLSPKENIYLILYKPVGCVTTRSDERGRDTVYKYLPHTKDWVFPVGRLDKDSEGLLIFTNDSEFSERMTKPSLKIKRTYEVLVDGTLSDAYLKQILKGTDIGRGEISKPVVARVIKELPGGSLLEISLTEGKNREIRRLMRVYGMNILMLKRVSFGPFKLGDLRPGEFRKIDHVGGGVKKQGSKEKGI